MTSLLCLTAAGLLAILPPSRVKVTETKKVEAARARRLLLAVGQTVPLQMSTRQAILVVVNENDKVVVVRTTPTDPTTVLVTGLAPGRTRITLTGADGKKEVCQIGGRVGVVR